jgi:FkbM family methyltransferase
MRRLVRPGMTALDIGANQGVYTLGLSRLVGTRGRVYAFEPDPELHRALVANLEQNGVANVEAAACALGREDAVLGLWRNVFNSGDNRLSGPAHGADAASVVEVPVRRLDGLHPGLAVDFIKLDVQGWELQVLEGMEGTLGRSPGVVLVFEFWPEGLRRAGAEPLELIRRLERLGFKVGRLGRGGIFAPFDPAAYVAQCTAPGYIDLLAVREEVKFKGSGWKS